MPPGALVQRGGQTFVNTYWPVDVPRKAGDGSPFLNHLAKVLPDERDRFILLCYMAACVQHKGVKFQWAPLLQGVEGNGKYALGCDLIAPDGYGEVIGGGQREENVATLRRRIAEHQLDEKDYSWYLDLRRFGSVPHSGFGLGVERTVAWMTGVEHVRETIPFARTPNVIRP
jgi:hypothetical protein